MKRSIRWRRIEKANGFDTKRRKALTLQEQQIFMDYLQKSKVYGHWRSIFEVMLGTSLRVGEVTGLTWDDLDFENNMISVNHTLVYYSHVRDTKENVLKKMSCQDHVPLTAHFFFFGSLPPI